MRSAQESEGPVQGREVWIHTEHQEPATARKRGVGGPRARGSKGPRAKGKQARQGPPAVTQAFIPLPKGALTNLNGRAQREVAQERGKGWAASSQT